MITHFAGKKNKITKSLQIFWYIYQDYRVIEDKWEVLQISLRKFFIIILKKKYKFDYIVQRRG